MKNTINCLSLSQLHIKKWRISRHSHLDLVYERLHGALSYWMKTATDERFIYDI